MQAAECGWVEANGVSLRYARSGRGKKVLVLVHEMCGCLESWHEVIPALESDFHVIRYDQRGFGLSEKGFDSLSLELMVADLRGLLEALDVREPVYVAGAALGAAIRLAYSLGHPAEVAAMVLASPTTGGVQPAVKARMEGWLGQVAAGGLRTISDQMLAVSYPEVLRTNPQRFAQHRLRWVAADPRSFIALNRMVMEFDLLPELQRCTTRTHVIGCQYDTIRTPERSREVAALIPGATYTEVESGHFLPVQSPEEFVRQVLLTC